MLLRFGVENHLSIQKRQELSFAASSLRDREDGLIPCSDVSVGTVIPAAIIYGANASGKTNFLNALKTMQRMVLWSQSRGTPDGGIPLRHEFRLDPAWSKRPSCFDVDFVLDGIRYHYGFEASDEAFVSEWLYEIPKAHRRKLYERDGGRFDFGRHLRGKNRSIAELTRLNSLFLSAAAQLGHPQLLGIYTYFQDMAFMLSPSAQDCHPCASGCRSADRSRWRPWHPSRRTRPDRAATHPSAGDSCHGPFRQAAPHSRFPYPKTT